MNCVPYWGTTDIRRHRTKFSQQGHLARGIVHPWYYFDVVWIKTFIIKIPHTYSDFCALKCIQNILNSWLPKLNTHSYEGKLSPY